MASPKEAGQAIGRLQTEGAAALAELSAVLQDSPPAQAEMAREEIDKIAKSTKK
jgi:hypothetical protein